MGRVHGLWDDARLRGKTPVQIIVQQPARRRVTPADCRFPRSPEARLAACCEGYQGHNILVLNSDNESYVYFGSRESRYFTWDDQKCDPSVDEGNE